MPIDHEMQEVAANADHVVVEDKMEVDQSETSVKESVWEKLSPDQSKALKLLQ